jgi:hypothetical protein
VNRIHFREPTYIGPFLIKFGHLGDQTPRIFTALTYFDMCLVPLRELDPVVYFTSELVLVVFNISSMRRVGLQHRNSATEGRHGMVVLVLHILGGHRMESAPGFRLLYS